MIEMPDRVADTFREWCVDVKPGDKYGGAYALGDFRVRLHSNLGEFAVGLHFVPEQRRLADFLITNRTLRLWFDERLMGALDFSAWKKVLSLHNPLCGLFMNMRGPDDWRFAHVRFSDGSEVLSGRQANAPKLQYIDVPEYAPDTHWRERYVSHRLTFNDMRGCL